MLRFSVLALALLTAACGGREAATPQFIETGNPAARIETLLAILAALDLDFRIGAREAGTSSADDLEDLLR